MDSRRLKSICVFFTGAYAYGCIELLARGRTHITMGLLGGVAMLFMHKLNDKRRNSMPLILACVSGALFITACEYAAGVILNEKLKMNIWDYSSLSFNYRGQICLGYTLRWVIVSLAGMFVDELLRYFVFKDGIYIIDISRLHIPAFIKQKGAKLYERFFITRYKKA